MSRAELAEQDAALRDDLREALRRLRAGTTQPSHIFDLDPSRKRKLVDALLDEVLACKEEAIPFTRIVIELRGRGFATSERTLRRAIARRTKNGATPRVATAAEAS